MTPCSKRVKLNRIALQEVVKLKLVPRRRRASESPTTVTPETPRQRVTGAASVQNGNELVHRFPTETDVGPKNVSQTISYLPKRLETYEDTQRITRETCYESCRGFQDEGPHTGDNCRHLHLSRLDHSELPLRRAVEASCCRFYGDCKYRSQQQRKLGKREKLNICPGPVKSVAKVKLRTENKFAKTSKKIVVLINQHTEVTVCDVAQYCNPCSHNCGFLLPDILKTKVVHCFKKDMRARFRFLPTCVGHDKCKSEECVTPKSSNFITRDAKNISQRLHEHQENLREHQEEDNAPSPSECLLPKGWTTDATPANYAVYQTTIWNRDCEENNPVTEMHRDKRKRIEDSDNGSLPSTSCFETISYNETKNIDSVKTERICCWMSEHSQPCLELTCVNGFGSSVRNIGVQRKPCNLNSKPPGLIESEVVCKVKEVQTDDDPESFTCQRVRAYLKKIKHTCARTYMPWPFCNSGCTFTANDSSTADGSLINHSDTLSSQAKASTAPSSELPNQAQTSKKRQEVNGQSFLNERNWSLHGHSFSCSPDTTDAEKSLPCPLLGTSVLSTPSQCESNPHTTTFSNSSTPFNEPGTNSSTSTPSLSTLALSDWEVSSPFTQGGLNSLLPTQLSFQLKRYTGVELADAHSTSASPSSPEFIHRPIERLQTLGDSALLQSSDSSQSFESSLLLPQAIQESDENTFSDGSPPKLYPYYVGSSVNREYTVSTEHCVKINADEFIILPLLSPISSPQQYSQKSSLPLGQDCLEKEEVKTDLSKHKQTKTKSPSSVGDIIDGYQDEIRDEIDYEDDVEQGNSSSKDPLGPEVKATLTSTVLREAISPVITKENDGEDSDNEGQSPCATEDLLSPSEMAGHEGDPTEAAKDSQPVVLDEFTAYEQDILLVDITPDDTELFKNIPEKSLLQLGPVRLSEAGKTRPACVINKLSSRVDGTSLETALKFSQLSSNYHWHSPGVEEEKDRPWRPQSSKTSNTCFATFKETCNMAQPDNNNNIISRGLERRQPFQTMNPSHNIAPFMALGNGSRITNLANLAEFRRQKSKMYCRQYFSESPSCGFKMCRFQHVPVDGDEKFCVESVTRFTNNPMCLHKAGPVFIGYYQNNPPGVFFSKPVFQSLIWALLKAGMVADVFSVLSISLTHKIVPSYEFLLALFNFVRDKGLMGLVPELMQLTLKMASAGVVLSLDCFDSVKITPEFQHTVHSASPASVEPLPEYMNLAYSLVEIELCAKQEDWRRMGEVFTSICQFNQHPNQVERISGRIAIALLSESKDKLSVPFVTFAEMVYQREGDDKIKSFVGRIGVSLMLRYHKTQQWAKGQKVVKVLSMKKVNYSTLKGLFGNEDRASRCCLITVAAETFLLSGSVEGALNTLRENEWFLSSCSWPCEPADMESRTGVLIRLAGKTSHRDTLEVLCNLPGIKEPNDMIDISRYSDLFSSHLQVCVDRHILPVASDTVNFMLSKKLPVDHNLLQVILHKLGKQNLWLRAREVFKHSLSVGYYQGVSSPAGFMSLMVPCHLGEVELALTFEMFITVNATAILNLSDSNTSSLSIILKRTQPCESEYLSAGSRLLSAACIPQPKLTVHYTAVNDSQEQVFTLDIASARRWLRCNHLWANEVWMHGT